MTVPTRSPAESTKANRSFVFRFALVVFLNVTIGSLTVAEDGYFEPREFERSPSYLFADQPLEAQALLTFTTFSDDGELLGYGDRQGNVFVRRSNDLSLLDQFSEPDPVAVRQIQFFADTPWVGCLHDDGELRIRAVDGGRVNETLIGQSKIVSFAYLPSLRRLFTLGTESVLETWDLNDSGTEFNKVDSIALDRPYSMLSWQDRSERLLLAGDDGWQLRQLPDLAIKIQAGLPSGKITAVALSPDGANFVVGFIDGKIRLRDAKTGKLIKSWKKHPNRVTSFAFSKTGKTLISGCERDRMRMWNIEAGEPANDRATGMPIIRSLCLHPINAQLAIAGESTALCVMNARRPSPESPALARPRTWNFKAAFAVRMLPERNEMLVVPKFGTAQRIDLKTFESTEGVAIQPGKARLSFAAISPDGSLSAHAYNSGEVRVFDVGSQKLLHKTLFDAGITWMEFDPKSARLAMLGNSPPRMGVIDARSGEKLAQIPILNHTSMETVCWAPDGESLVTSGISRRDGRTIGVLTRWSAEDGQILKQFESPEVVGHMAISPDGTRLVTGGITGWIGVFDQDLNPINLFECGGIGGLHAFRLIDNRQLLVGTYKGSVLLVDIETGDEQQRFEPLPRRMGMPIRAIDFDPKRGLIGAVGGYDGQETSRIYSINDEP